MKKSTLLSLATAGAVIATSAGTFALWDTIEDTSEGSVTMANAIVLEAQAGTYTLDSRKPGASPVISGDFSFKVTDADSTADTLTLTPKVVLDSDKNNDSAEDYSKYFDIKITQEGESNGLAGFNEGKAVDSVITRDDVANKYTITLTENNSIGSEAKTQIAGQKLTVLVKGELSKTATPAVE